VVALRLVARKAHRRWTTAGTEPSPSRSTTVRRAVSRGAPGGAVPASNLKSCVEAASLLAQPNDRFSAHGRYMHRRSPRTAEHHRRPPLTAHYQPFDVRSPLGQVQPVHADPEIQLRLLPARVASADWDRQQTDPDISEPCSSSSAVLRPPAAWPFSSTATVTEEAALFLGSVPERLPRTLHAQYSEELRLTSTAGGRCSGSPAGTGRYGATSHSTPFYPATNNDSTRLRHDQPRDNHRKVDIDQYQHSARCRISCESLKATVGARYYSIAAVRCQCERGFASAPVPRSSARVQLGCHAEAEPRLHSRRQHDALRHHLQGLPPRRPNSPIPSPPCPGNAPTQFGPDSV